MWALRRPRLLAAANEPGRRNVRYGIVRRSFCCIGAMPTAITLIYEWFSGTMPSHWIRAAAGFPLGAVVMLIVLAATTLEQVVEIH